MKTALFVWDWKEQPPIQGIVEAVSKIPRAKAWSLDEGSDSFVLCIAATEKEALKCWLQEHKDWIDEEWKAWKKEEASSRKEFEKSYYPQIFLWKD